jgi:hypothetical protein
LRSLTIHILLVFAALNVVSLEQFSKFPLLVSHFVDHWERDHSLGLVDFLGMHYLDHHINDDDEKKDNELPFKNVSFNSIQVFTVPDHELNIVSHRSFIMAVDKPIVAGDQFVLAKFISCLFRPPRVSA